MSKPNSPLGRASDSRAPHCNRSFGIEPWLRHYVVCGSAMGWIFASGCAVTPPVAPHATSVAEPMTLPRYLGVDTVATGLRRVVYRGRLRISGVLPMFEPQATAAAPVALCDPSCLASPAPAVAAAAAKQQAEASAPVKVKALAYLATLNNCGEPQIEEAFLAAFDDPSESVRVAAVQGIIDMNGRCGECAKGCSGCCTPAISSKLQQLAFATDSQGCWCEPSAKVRRLARIGTCQCNVTAETAITSLPQEFPATSVVELSRMPPPP